MIGFAPAGAAARKDARSLRAGAGGTSTVPATLQTLAAEVPGARVEGDAETPVADLAYDSRAVEPGALFFCVRGHRFDGHDFAAEAIARGAAAVVVERRLDVGVPALLVPVVRRAMGPVAAAFFAHPSRALTVVGVTGTNGKTTTTYMLESVFRALAMTPGIIGTVETRIADGVEPVTRTTPEAIDLQRLLARMRDAGVSGCAIEVSSHGLDQWRLEGTRFACAAFTNLTQDHLDYHGTMEDYFWAKAMLFRAEMSARAVVNVGDPYGRRLTSQVAVPLTTFALDGDADVRALSLAMDAAGSRLVADVAGTEVTLRVPLPARYNVANALAVLGVARALEWPLEAAGRGIAAAPQVPGRLERVDAGQDFTVLVDYAHTPDSLEGVLRAAREITPRGARLVVVFGCGGDRDRGKRPLMGQVGVALSDRAIITSDNPRSEDPMRIIEEIEAGARDAGGPFESIPDRREAIGAALRRARAGDVVVIAGKGHETGQELADRTVPFDDRTVAREVLATL